MLFFVFIGVSCVMLVHRNTAYTNTPWKIFKGVNVTNSLSSSLERSLVRCVDSCLRVRERGICSVVAYEKSSSLCYHSVDQQEYLISSPHAGMQVVNTLIGELQSQWVSSVLNYSTEWTTTEFGTIQLLGPPDIDGYGDSGKSWCALTVNSSEFLELVFPTPVYVTSVEIYETWYGGSITYISCYQNGGYSTLWSTEQTEVITYFRIFTPTLTGICFSNRIKLDLHGHGGEQWVKIDAVSLTGYIVTV